MYDYDVVHSPDLSQPVALVPLTEANEDAMENKRFQKLLRKLGMRAPADEQVWCFYLYIPFILYIYVCV